jgi:hypothetical protein
VACGRIGYDPLAEPGGVIDSGSVIDSNIAADANTFTEVVFPTTQAKIQGLVVDASGNVYFGGRFNGSVDFGGGVMTSNDRSGYLTSLTAGGAFRWSLQIDGVGDFDEVQRISVLPNGNIAVAGAFSGTVDFGNGSLTSMGDSDNYAAQYTSDGQLVNVVQLGDTGPGGFSDGSTRLVGDTGGNLFHTGIFRGTVDFGGGPVSSQTTNDIFMRSTTSSGAFRWVRRFGLTRFNAVFDLALGSAGNLYFTGFYEGNIDFGGGPLPYGGVQDAAVVSLDTDGNHRWSVGAGGGGFDYGRAIAVDADNNVYATGFFTNSFDIGGTNLVSAGNTDGWFASFTSDGTHRWSFSFGAGDCDSGAGLALAPDGTLYISGAFGDTIQLGTTTLVSNGSRDGFVAVVSPTDGSIGKVLQFGATGLDTIREIAVAADAVWVAGSEDGSQNCSANPLPSGDTLTLRRLPLGL